MRFLASVLLTLAAAGSGVAQSEKPKCSKATQGQFWPDTANASRTEARTSAQRGELEICTFGRWKYRWEPLTVRVTQFKQPLNASPEPQNSASSEHRER